MIKFIKRILFYVGVALVLSFIKSNFVNAAEVIGPSQTSIINGDIYFPTSYRCFNGDGGSELSSSAHTNDFAEFDNGNYYTSLQGKNYYQCNSSGTDPIHVINFNKLTDGNLLWSATLWVSTSNSLKPTLDGIGLSDDSYTARNQILYNGSNATLYSYRVNGPFTFENPNFSGGYVDFYSIYIVFKSNSNSTYLASRLRYPGNEGTSYLWGYNLNFLGVTDGLNSSDISNVISSSGLATASSVQQVQTSINQVNNQLSDLNTTQQQTNQKLDNIDDTLNNDNVDSNNTTSTITNLSNQVASNSVISDLLLLPVTLFQNILNSINGTCSTFNLGSLYGSNLSLPCINLQALLGNAIYTAIDILISGIFILSIRKKFVDIFESLSSLKDGGNALE